MRNENELLRQGMHDEMAKEEALEKGLEVAQFEINELEERHINALNKIAELEGRLLDETDRNTSEVMELRREKMQVEERETQLAEQLTSVIDVVRSVTDSTLEDILDGYIKYEFAASKKQKRDRHLNVLKVPEFESPEFLNGDLLSKTLIRSPRVRIQSHGDAFSPGDSDPETAPSARKSNTRMVKNTEDFTGLGCLPKIDNSSDDLPEVEKMSQEQDSSEEFGSLIGGLKRRTNHPVTNDVHSYRHSRIEDER